jgi:hypothetical protein
MSNILRRIESKYVLIFWVACLVIFGIFSPSILTNSNVYMGMLIGYIQAKTQILQLLDSNFGKILVGSYLSLRYNFGLSSTNHDGVKILSVNALYFAVLTTFLYIVAKHFGKFSRSKSIVISAAVAGILMIAVGVSVLALNSKILTQNLTDKPYTYYIVQEGDTCEKIAFDYNVSTENIAKWNSLSPNCSSITVGQSLVISLVPPP